jgi:hypothetical protein
MSNVIDSQAAQGRLTIRPYLDSARRVGGIPIMNRRLAQTVSCGVGRYDVFDKSGSARGGVRIGDGKVTVWILRSR